MAVTDRHRRFPVARYPSNLDASGQPRPDQRSGAIAQRDLSLNPFDSWASTRLRMAGVMGRNSTIGRRPRKPVRRQRTTPFSLAVGAEATDETLIESQLQGGSNGRDVLA